MNHPKPTPEQFTHNGVLMQPHFDNAVRAWEKMARMDVEKAAEGYAFNASLPMFYEPKKEAFIAGVEWAKQQQGEGWISVKDRLPEENLEVLIAIKNNDIPIQAYYSERHSTWYGSYEVREYMEDGYVGDSELTKYTQENITHWRPLPPPPTA